MQHKSILSGLRFPAAMFASMAIFVIPPAAAQELKAAPPYESLMAENLITISESQLDLVFWLMGSRQTINTMSGQDDTFLSHNKQMINSGMVPNRILSRTFLNKAINYDRTIT